MRSIAARKATSSTGPVAPTQAAHRDREHPRVFHLERPHERDEVEPLLLAQLAHEAEVEERDPTRRLVQHDVAGVWVAMEEAVDEQLLDERSDERPRHGVAVDAGIELVGMGGLDALHEVHDEDPPGAELRVHLGDARRRRSCARTSASRRAL